MRNAAYSQLDCNSQCVRSGSICDPAPTGVPPAADGGDLGLGGFLLKRLTRQILRPPWGVWQTHTAPRLHITRDSTAARTTDSDAELTEKPTCFFKQDAVSQEFAALVGRTPAVAVQPLRFFSSHGYGDADSRPVYPGVVLLRNRAL